MSCGIDIPPSFVLVIQANKCPGCEGEILTAGAKDLIEELKSALEKMPNDPIGLSGWLVSNYEMKKVGTGEPVNFYRKPEPQIQYTSPEQRPLKGDKPKPISRFMENAEVSPEAINQGVKLALAQKNKNKYQQIVEAIHSGDPEQLEAPFEDEAPNADLMDDPYYQEEMAKANPNSTMTGFPMNEPPLSVEELELLSNAVEGGMYKSDQKRLNAPDPNMARLQRLQQTRR